MSESSTDEEVVSGGVGPGQNLSDSSGQSSEDISDVNAAGSSSAENQDANKPGDMVSAVRAALNEGKEQSSGSGEDEGEEKSALDPKKAGTPGEDEGELGELTDEELNSYKPKTRRRFEKLDRENKAFKAELDALRPEAEGYRTVQKFCREANLTREDVNTGFNIMNMMKNDPVKAYEALTPIYNALREVVGDVLPRDLQEQVQSGQITMKHAQELSRHRAQSHLNESRRESEQERQERERNENAVQQTEALKTDVAKATTEWESRWKASDPDFSLKQSRVMEAIELGLLREVDLARRGQPNKLPKSAQDAVRFCEEVKAKVESEFKRLVPRKTSITPVRGNGVTDGSKPKPNSIRDAVAMAVGHA